MRRGRIIAFLCLVALARKLAVVLHRMLVDATNFVADKASVRVRPATIGFQVSGRGTTPLLLKRSPVAGTTDQVRPL